MPRRRAPASVAEPKIFISYRREDTSAHAGRLYDSMAAEFGDGNVFMDVDLAPGIDFVERITDVVAACHVLIVVMGPKLVDRARMRTARSGSPIPRTSSDSRSRPRCGAPT